MNKQQLIEIENLLDPKYDTTDLSINDLRNAVSIDLNEHNYPQHRK